MKIPNVTFIQAKYAYTDPDLKHYGFAIHNTANTASARKEANYAQNRTDGVSTHFVIDSVEVLQLLDTNVNAGHAGSPQGNGNALSWEFVGLNNWTRQQWLDNIVWNEFGRVVVYILKNDPDYIGFQVRRASVAEMKSNPLVKAFYSHNDMRLAWGYTTHDDPGPNFPWDRLFQAVNDVLDPSEVDVDFNQDAKLTGMFDQKKTVVLQTGPNTTATFPVPLTAAITKLDTKLDAILAALAAIGTNTPEVAQILDAIANMNDDIMDEVRDAVADLGEGGAAKVRDDA